MSSRQQLVPAKPPAVAALPGTAGAGTVVSFNGIAHVYNHGQWWEIVPIVVSETAPENVPPNTIWIGPELEGATPQESATPSDGREIELQTNATHIQWRYVGDPTWTDLVAFSELVGESATPESATPDEVDISAHEGDIEDPHAAAGYIKGNFERLIASLDPPATPSHGDVWIRLPAEDATPNESATPSEIDASVPIGGIIMYSGDVLSLPAEWALCDGTNGTPDLRGMFIVGAGGAYTQGDTGGSETVTLTTAQMPVHTHTGPSHSHSVGSLTTNSTGSHSHALPYRTNDAVDHNHKGSTSSVAQGGTGAGENWSTTLTDINTLAEGSHSHTISGSTAAAGTGVTGSTGSGEAHENRPPYYALAYIMRVETSTGASGISGPGIISTTGVTYSSKSDQYGYRFSPTENLSVVRLAALVSGAYTLQARLWNVTTSELLVDTTITTESEAWTQSDAFAPVSLLAGAQYVVAIYNGGSSYFRASATTVTEIAYQAEVGFDTYIYGTSGPLGSPTTTFATPLGLADVVFG